MVHRYDPCANTKQGEVVLMWKGWLFAALRFLVFFTGALWILTTKAC
nr:hypothetical protein [uncultured Oscillibacter sp.]